MPSISGGGGGGGGNTTAQVVASGKVIPVADAVGVTVDTTTYNDTIKGSGKLTTLVFPADAGAIAIALAGDVYPRWIMGADPSDWGLLMCDGTSDPTGARGIQYQWSGASLLSIGAEILASAAGSAGATGGTPYHVPALNQLSPLYTITSGALPTVQLVTTAGAQISATRDAETVTPVTFNSGAANTATCLVALSPDNVTYSALGTESEPVGVALAGTIHLVKVRVPAGWYLKLTATNATLGVTTYY